MTTKASGSELKTLEEAASLADIQVHVLHLWLKKFPVLTVKKNPQGQIGFDYRDISLIKGLKYFLIDEAKTIPAVQKILNERGIGYVAAYGKEKGTNTPTDTAKKSILSLFSKDKPKTTPTKQTEIARQLNEIFAKKDSNPESNISESNILAPNPSSLPQEPMLDSPISASNHADAKNHFDAFEEKWRHFMHDKGKTAFPQEVRATRKDYAYDPEDEILFLDDEPPAFTAPTSHFMVDVSAIKNVQHLTRPKKQQPSAEEIVRPAISHDMMTSIKRQEKILHVLARLDLLRSELQETHQVITEALQAFGLSRTEDAFSKHDTPSAY